jgi:hypothetical protein
MTETGTPSSSTRLGRSRRSHSEVRLGSVEIITSSYSPPARASLTDSNGSPPPRRPSTGASAAFSSSLTAVSRFQSAAFLDLTPGMSSVNFVGRSDARRLTSWRSIGVEAVRLATMSVRRGVDVSMFSSGLRFVQA